MFEHFYHEILRKTIISFGSLFNNIIIKHYDNDNNVTSVIKVPLAYGPKQKFLARLNESPDLKSPVQMTLPRMSFETTGLYYDTSRKVSSTQYFLTSSKDSASKVKKSYLPVPYNLDFELNIMCKLNDDMLQIIEQILPYFQPTYTVTVDLVDTIGEKRDIPISIVGGVNMDDNYEGNFDVRRALIYTIKFTAKTYLFGPVLDAEKDIIKKSTISFSGNTYSTDLKYSSTPVATKSYEDNFVSILSTDLDIVSTTIKVTDSSNITENTFIVIDDETLKVEAVVENELIVTRGEYGTPISTHVSGTKIKLITEQDNSLIEFGDDFGFSGSF